MMDMPTNCPECGQVVEFDSMSTNPRGNGMVCDDCFDRIEAELNSGSDTDAFGNELTWHSDDCTVSMSVNGEEVTAWQNDAEPEENFREFMLIWNTAQAKVAHEELDALRAENQRLKRQVKAALDVGALLLHGTASDEASD